MATHVEPVPLTLPDTSGNVYFEPGAINFESNDRYPGEVCVFKDTATRIGCGFQFRVPQNYVGSPVFLVGYATTATSGTYDVEIDYTAIATTETLDPSADQENLGATDTVPGTARIRDEVSLSATAGNFAAGDIVKGTLFRDGSESDTVAASIYVIGLWFQYVDV
jgi:hypothetical protein